VDRRLKPPAFPPFHAHRIHPCNQRMVRLAIALALLGVLALAPPAAARLLLDEQQCPPPGFDALQSFDVNQ